MKSVEVHDPHGRRWRISVRMLPWRLRWRGPWARQKRKADADQDTLRPRWYDALDIGNPFAALDEGLGGFLLAILCVVGLVVALVFVVPLFVFLVEVLIVALLVAGAVALRVLFRQPWLVDAVADDGARMTWKVVGYRKSRQVVDEIGSLVSKGVTSPAVHDAVLVR